MCNYTTKYELPRIVFHHYNNVLWLQRWNAWEFERKKYEELIQEYYALHFWMMIRSEKFKYFTWEQKSQEIRRKIKTKQSVCCVVLWRAPFRLDWFLIECIRFWRLIQIKHQTLTHTQHKCQSCQWWVRCLAHSMCMLLF